VMTYPNMDEWGRHRVWTLLEDGTFAFVLKLKISDETYTLIEEGVPINILIWKASEETYALIEEWLKERGCFIEGVTRDNAGVPLPNCVVWLFRTSDKVFIKETLSNGSGDYVIIVGNDVTEHFIRSHKDGAPNIFGTTDRNVKGKWKT